MTARNLLVPGCIPPHFEGDSQQCQTGETHADAVYHLISRGIYSRTVLQPVKQGCIPPHFEGDSQLTKSFSAKNFAVYYLISRGNHSTDEEIVDEISCTPPHFEGDSQRSCSDFYLMSLYTTSFRGGFTAPSFQ